MHDRGEMLLCKHIKAGKTRIGQSWRLWIIPVLLILLCPGFSDFSEHIVYHLNRLKARCKRKAQQRTCRSQFVLIRSAFRPKVLCLNIYNHIHICWYSQQKLVLLDLAGGTLDRGEKKPCGRFLAPLWCFGNNKTWPKCKFDFALIVVRSKSYFNRRAMSKFRLLALAFVFLQGASRSLR